MEIVLVILLLLGVMFLGRFLSRPAPAPQGAPPPPRPRRPPPPPPPPPQRLVWRILRRLWDYTRSFSYHCGLGAFIGLGLYCGMCDPVLKQHIQTNLIVIFALVIMLTGMAKIPGIGGLLRSSVKQVPKDYKARFIRWCWTNGLAAAIVMGYLASRNAPALF